MRFAAVTLRAGLFLLALSLTLLAQPGLLTPGTALSSTAALPAPLAAGEVNLALGKPATQSSTGWDSPASLAVDGNTNGDWWAGSVSHTEENYQAWWQVDLGTAAQISRVDVWLMTVCCSSHGDFDIKVSADGNNWTSFYVAGPVDQVSVPFSGHARYVRVQLRGLGYLALAEVQAFGFAQGAYAGAPASIPGVVQAEDFDEGGEGVSYHDFSPANEGGLYRSTAVDIGSCGAGPVLGWNGGGEWTEYTVNVAASGNYTVRAVVGEESTVGSLHVEFDGEDRTGPMTIPLTGGWCTLQTISKGGVYLAAGTHIMRVVTDNVGVVLDSFRLVAETTPYTATPIAIPGVVQVEYYDQGGEGVAYHDTTPDNETGSAFRAPTGVDVVPTAVGYVQPGEWLKYTVNVASTGSYTVAATVAAPAAGGTFHVEFDDVDRTGPMVVPATGGWGAYQTITKSGVQLTAGQHMMRLVMDTATTGYVADFDSLSFNLEQGPYTGTPIAVPGTVEAELFDKGGEGVGYHDATPGSHGQDYDQPPSYPPPSLRQPTDVDIYKSAAGYSNGYLVVMQAGDWMKYAADVAAAGAYTLEAKTYYWGAPGGTFHVEADGVNVTGPLQLPGGSAWAMVTKAGVQLPAGRHTLRVVCDTNGSDGVYMGDIDFIRLTAEQGPPAAPSGLAASAASANQINLSWMDVSTNETGYRIERKAGAGGAYAEVAAVGVNVNSYADAGLTPGTQYFYRVRGVNAAAASAYSNEAGATTQNKPAPGAAYFLSLNGANGYVVVPNSPSLNISGPITVEAWINTNATTLQSIVERYNLLGTDDGGYALRLDQGRLRFGIVRNAGTYDFVDGGTPVGTGVWHHVAGVFDGSQLRVYLDGRLDGAKASTVAPAPGTQSLKIGASGNGGGASFFNGLIDEVRVSSGVEYAANFTARSIRTVGSTFVNPNDGQRGVWLFDDDTADDSSGNNNHGTLIGGAFISTTASDVATLRYDNQAAGTAADQRIIIPFDNLDGQKVSDQYRDAKFCAMNTTLGSSCSAQAAGTYFTYATTRPPAYESQGARLTRGTQNDLDSGQTSINGRFRNFRVEFARPASNIEFEGIGVLLFSRENGCSPVAQINVYSNDTLTGQPQTYNLCGRPAGSPTDKAVLYDLNKVGAKNVTAIEFHSITDIDGLDFDNFSFTVPPPPEVTSVEFEQLATGGPIDDHPTDPVFGCGAKCGKRIFPDKQNPGDRENRAKVGIKANTTFPQGTKIYFKSFDLDDPSSNDPDLDDTISQGLDNKGGPLRTGTLSAGYGVTDASGVARVEFETTKQPGDNFMIAASADEAYLSTLTESGTGLKDGNGNAVPNSQAKSSEMLTVWRNLHIEVDSMGTVTGNKVVGTVTSSESIIVSAAEIPGGVDQQAVCPPEGCERPIEPRRHNYVCVQQTLERDRFENGRLVVGAKQYPIKSNEEHCLDVGNDSENQFQTPPEGASVLIYDDDDFNNNNGTNKSGDEGEDIPAPDLSLVQHSDKPSENVFAPAYVRPVYDVGDNNGSVPFAANVADESQAARRALYDFDQISTEASADFWTVYLLGAYQYTSEHDLDPDVEPGPVNGIVDNSIGSDPDGGLHRDGFGAILFLEVEREARSLLSEGFTGSPYAMFPYATPHEIGHLFGARHEDTGLMSQQSGTFSPRSLNFIRSSQHP